MAVEAVATGMGGAGGLGSMPRVEPHDAAALAQPNGAGQPSAAEASPPAQQASLESRAARPGGPAETALHQAPPEVAAGPHRPGNSLGQSVMDGVNGVNGVQKGDTAWRTGGAGKAPPANEPSLKVAAREPGPAAAQLRPDAAPDASPNTSHGPDVAGHPTTQPGKSDNPGFDHMVHQLEQVSGQVVQVSIVSKTTSSFTGSLNKLLSSG